MVGAITSHGRNDFNEILSGLAGQGYRFGPMVMDAVHFVPQSRPRLFIVAVDDSAKIPAGLVRLSADPAWHPRALDAAHGCLPLSVKDRWIWWNLPLPNSPTATLSSLIEPEPDGVKWHSVPETRHILSLMSETNRRKVHAARSSGS